MLNPKRQDSVSPKVVIKYVLIQVPGLALWVVALVVVGHWISLPPWVFWGLVAAWVVKDIVLFPLVWRSYDFRDNAHPLIGAQGIAEEPLDPSGYIRIRGELWRAEPKKRGLWIEKGGKVRVCAVRGLTLIVEPGDGAEGIEKDGA